MAKWVAAGILGGVVFGALNWIAGGASALSAIGLGAAFAVSWILAVLFVGRRRRGDAHR